MDYSFSSNVVICAKLYCYSWNAVIIVEENACILTQWKILFNYLRVTGVLHGNWCVMTDDTLFFSAILLFMHSQLCEKLMYYFVGEKAAFPGFGGGGAIILVFYLWKHSFVNCCEWCWSMARLSCLSLSCCNQAPSLSSWHSTAETGKMSPERDKGDCHCCFWTCVIATSQGRDLWIRRSSNWTWFAKGSLKRRLHFVRLGMCLIPHFIWCLITHPHPLVPSLISDAMPHYSKNETQLFL